jgi:hypothetical protein
MRRDLGLIASALITAALAGCAGTGGATGAGAPSSQPSPALSSAPAVAASSGPCTTKACIVTDAKQLKGTVAKDNAVMTKVACKKSTVKQVVGGTYTVHCTITYSDGMVARGIASVLTGKGDVDWEPVTIVSYGSSG